MALQRVYPICLAVAVLMTGFAGVGPSEAQAMPAFARAYGVPCSTCHVSIPRRNDFGDSFRKAGYRWPHGKTTFPVEPVEMRGQSLLEGLLPANLPVGFTTSMSASLDPIQNTIFVENDDGTVGEEDVEANMFRLGSPGFLMLLGASFGDNFSLFGSASGSELGEMVFQFRILEGDLNLKVGQFKQTTSMFLSNEGLVGTFALGNLTPNDVLVSGKRGVELNGILPAPGFLENRVFWAAGTALNDPGNSRGKWDFYGHLEERFGNGTEDFRGHEPEIDLDADPTAWDEIGITLNQWAYVGRRTQDGNPTLDSLRLGLEAKLQVYDVRLWTGGLLSLDDETLYETDNDGSYGNYETMHVDAFAELSYRVSASLWVMGMWTMREGNTKKLEDNIFQRYSLGAVAVLLENVRCTLSASTGSALSPRGTLEDASDDTYAMIDFRDTVASLRMLVGF